MKFRFRVFLLIFCGCVLAGSPSQAVDPKLLRQLLLEMSKGSDDALKHGDEVLKKVVPKLDPSPNPTLPSGELKSGAIGGKSAARSYRKCNPSEGFPKSSETLVITGNKVNIRACASTRCKVVGRVKKGKYRVNALKRANCWIEFSFNQRNGKRRKGFIFEKYASVK